MTEQEAYDVMARHLLTQNAKSINGALCMYRDLEGRKCAVGVLISDEEYEPDMETCSATTLKCKFNCKALEGLPEKLLNDAQIVHDNYDPKDWVVKLRALAERYNLSDAVVDEFGD
jgi:hypothetical protein